MEQNIAMNLGDKTRRKEWAEGHVPSTASDWNKIIWNDEKRFSLDGRDGNARYWHDKEKVAWTFSKSYCCGGLIMVWAGFSKTGKTELAFIDKKWTQFCIVMF